MLLRIRNRTTVQVSNQSSHMETCTAVWCWSVFPNNSSCVCQDLEKNQHNGNRRDCLQRQPDDRAGREGSSRPGRRWWEGGGARCPAGNCGEMWELAAWPVTVGRWRISRPGRRWVSKLFPGKMPELLPAARWRSFPDGAGDGRRRWSGCGGEGDARRWGHGGEGAPTVGRGGRLVFLASSSAAEGGQVAAAEDGQVAAAEDGQVAATEGGQVAGAWGWASAVPLVAGRTAGRAWSWGFFLTGSGLIVLWHVQNNILSSVTK
jgi:hypothetical protein